MATFLELLTASDEDLVNAIYKMSSIPDKDFLVRIDRVAAQLKLNHTQLLCALGFNKHIRDLTDILSVLGFTSYKTMCFRRDELFTHDTYQQLSIDNVLDIYSEHIEDQQILDDLRKLLEPRLTQIEQIIGKTNDPSFTVSYKMEINAIYNGGIATADFAIKRLCGDIGQYRLLTNEAGIINQNELVPPSNIFFLDSVLGEEKKSLIDSGFIPRSMIENRLSNQSIGEDEREILQQALEE
jgi:hypothetical protein